MENLPNILIVDDISINLELLEYIILKFDVNLIQALSGSDALTKIRGIDLALAIIDVEMPEMNGYELALKINEERLDHKVPIIFLTARYADEPEVIKGYSSGAVDYIVKPVASQILKSKISVFIDLFYQKQIIVRNVTLLKKFADDLTKSNVALKRSELKYRSYIDNAPDGVFIVDDIGRYIEVNEAACRITGYSKDELLKMSISDMLQKEHLEGSLADFKAIAIHGLFKADLSFTHKSGTSRWWAIAAVKLTETRFLCFIKDITERKRTEEELESSLDQLHQLTQYIEKVRENERVAISRELHDDLGQSLTAVKIELGLIRKNVSDKEVTLKINKVSALVSETIKTVQRLTSQLRPEIIEDLGLKAAIEWYTNEFAQRNGVEVSFDMDSLITTSPDASLIIFRVMQESLTNISRHAKATHVDIVLSKIDNDIHFRISDNGIGITEDKIHSKKSFGIMSMKERAVSLGGHLDIYRGGDHGTVIKLVFPLISKCTYENSYL
jgi:PAS domain S-box-containing protein